MYIDPQAYWHEEYLEKEYNRIFSRGLFVGDAGALQSEGDYISYRVCGRPFVTRYASGQANTFDNVCLHRANLIDPLGQGNRPFRCGYHGWQYDSCGTLERTPLATEGCVSRRQLQSYPTVSSKGLVFAAIEGELAADFGAVALDKAGFDIGEIFHRDVLAHDANWKMLVENVLESYHLSFVHQTSFVPTGITSTSPSRIDYIGSDSCFRIASKHEDGAKARLIPGATSDYLHAFIFPNLFISITGGLVGFISHFKPSAPGQTLLEWSLFETPLLRSQKTPVRNYIKKNAVEFTNKVLNEDLVVLNNSQVGIRHARGAHQLQEIEGRIAHFHQTYLKMMS